MVVNAESLLVRMAQNDGKQNENRVSSVNIPTMDIVGTTRGVIKVVSVSKFEKWNIHPYSISDVVAANCSVFNEDVNL